MHACIMQKMARLRKEKESELFQQFESHQNYMCKQLQEQMQKASSDEDSRTALAAEQQQAKREVSTLQEMHPHSSYLLY